MIDKKKILFAPPFPKILFTGEKNKTFRVTGGENYKVGDKISLCYANGDEFAVAVIKEKYKKRFKDLTTSDWQGHERFASDEEMYKIYSNWEGFQITPKTQLEIICYEDFKLTSTHKYAQRSPK